MVEAGVGLVIGLGIVAVMMFTAPWWLPVIDPFMNRWCEWIDRRIDQR